MDAIQTFDKAVAKKLSAELVAAAQAVAEKYGLKVAGSGGSILPGELTLKVKFTSATGPSQGELNFKQYGDLYGFRPEDFGATFVSMGREFKITGLLPNRPKRPVEVIEVRTGKAFVFDAETAKRALVRKGAPG